MSLVIETQKQFQQQQNTKESSSTVENNKVSNVKIIDNNIENVKNTVENDKNTVENDKNTVENVDLFIFERLPPLSKRILSNTLIVDGKPYTGKQRLSAAPHAFSNVFLYLCDGMA